MNDAIKMLRNSKSPSELTDGGLIEVLKHALISRFMTPPWRVMSIVRLTMLARILRREWRRRDASKAIAEMNR